MGGEVTDGEDCTGGEIPGEIDAVSRNAVNLTAAILYQLGDIFCMRNGYGVEKDGFRFQIIFKKSTFGGNGFSTAGDLNAGAAQQTGFGKREQGKDAVPRQQLSIGDQVAASFLAIVQNHAATGFAIYIKATKSYGFSVGQGGCGAGTQQLAEIAFAMGVDIILHAANGLIRIYADNESSAVGSASQSRSLVCVSADIAPAGDMAGKGSK